MARNMYGATSADFTLTSGGRVVPGATLTIWSARTGGTQITDLLDVDSVAATTVTSDADGSIVYYGPNNDKTVHWADSGVGNRIAVRPTDITGDPPVLSIGTVGTGAAAASLTGTSEAPVLNLTLPTAGANGVDTAAIQNGAVTSAKIADGTIATGDIADGAVTAAKLGSDVRIGNLLTANQASVETDTSGWTVDGGVTLSKQSSPTYHGSSSLLATCTGTGAGQFSAAGARIPVTAGDTVTFMAQAHAGVGSRQVQALLLFYDAASGGTLIGGDSVKGPLVTTAGSWRQASLTTVVPSGATHAVPSVGLAAGGATDAVYFDAFSFHRGAAGQWAMPGQVIPGTSHIATNGASHLSGTGSPEGVVTAAPGSTWLQTDSTTDVKGWIRWVKATGTGNTGWQAGPEADTGVRNISYTSGLANWTAGTLRLRRMGNIVSVRADGVGMAALATIYNLPTGFRASSFGEAIGTVMREGAATGNPYWMAIVAANVVNYGAALSGTFSASYRFYGEWVFQTADAWPSTLP